MGRKRKSESELDEVDRMLYSTFRGAANSLSQVYAQAMNHQKLSFHAGERHAIEKLYHWLLRQHDAGSRMTTTDILSYLQNEMDHVGEDAWVSPRLPSQLQHSESTVQATNSSSQPSLDIFAQATVGLVPPNANSDQAKNCVFSNALSSPVQTLQPYHLAQEGMDCSNSFLPAGNGDRYLDSNQNQETNSPSSNDTSMDMHSDSPAHES